MIGKGIHIVIEKYLADAIKDAEFGDSSAGRIAACVRMHIEMPVLVFKVTHIDSDVVFYGITKRAYYFKEDFRFTIRLGDSPFSKEVKRVGLHAFNFLPSASFKTMGEALVYKEFMINSELNKGKDCYNVSFDLHQFTRYLVIPLKQDVVDKFLSICYYSSSTASKVLDRLITMFNRKNKGRKAPES